MKTNKGFTLIELLIVIAIIGILSAALLPTILSAPARGRDAARIGNLNSIVAAIEAYNSDNGGYPDTPATTSCVAEIDNFGSYFAGGNIPSDPSGARTLPDDPAASDPDTCIADGGYYYRKIGTASVNYIVGTVMENVNANNTSTALETFDGTDMGAAPFTNYVLIK